MLSRQANFQPELMFSALPFPLGEANLRMLGYIQLLWVLARWRANASGLSFSDQRLATAAESSLNSRAPFRTVSHSNLLIGLLKTGPFRFWVLAPAGTSGAKA